MSPIIGLTDQARAAFPRLGKLRKGGAKVKNAQGQEIMGPDLPHFRFVSDRPEVQAAFDEAYGASPSLLHVYLPYPTVDENFETWKERWVAGGLAHRCDGQTMSIWLNPDGTYSQGSRPCDSAQLAERDRCKQVGRLSLWLPELLRAGFVGFVTLETHSINDLLSIQGSLMAALALHIGHQEGLRGIEWTLRRAKEKISTPMGNGKRARREKWMVKLEPAADWAQLQIQAAHNATMMLPAPTTSINHETGEMCYAVGVTDIDPPDDDDIDDGEYIEPEPPTVEEQPANPKMVLPGSELEQKWTALVFRAKEFGLAIPTLNIPCSEETALITCKELADAIKKAKAVKAKEEMF